MHKRKYRLSEILTKTEKHIYIYYHNVYSIMEKIKVEFNSEGVTATLTNRVYRNGITMMVNVDKAENKGESIDPKLIEDLETDYLLSCLELENVLTSQLAQKKKDSWASFGETYGKLKDEEKPLFRGIIGNIKKVASNVLTGRDSPFEPPFGLPPYVQPITPPGYFDEDFWQEIFNEAETMEATGKGLVAGVGAVAGALVAAGAAATLTGGAFVAAGVATGCAAFEGGVAIGNAVNEYMGWETWK
ncbi:hypothetical protein C5S29_05745 [ANME-1 cluster archaeon GoMg3.2]|nr:hypothetical protein [ANME-1 cluster archaeon GoMg3.2]